MCCFSGAVAQVADTRIFARSVAVGSADQWLAYEATLRAELPVAMILPLPVRPGSGEDAVRFVDLSGYPELFTALDAAFPRPQPASRGLTKSAPAPAAAPLAVVRVGAFVASFVPTLADFARLDPRFRLADDVWAQLPAYAAYGFAVFELAPGAQRLHPMALTFPRADPRRLYFPTVHVHDGVVHPRARYDHALFLQQLRGERLDLGRFAESALPAGDVVAEAGGVVVDRDLHVYRRELRGDHRNEDQWA